jgi:hypothetical protein
VEAKTVAYQGALVALTSDWKSKDGQVWRLGNDSDRVPNYVVGRRRITDDMGATEQFEVCPTCMYSIVDHYNVLLFPWMTAITSKE